MFCLGPEVPTYGMLKLQGITTQLFVFCAALHSLWNLQETFNSLSLSSALIAVMCVGSRPFIHFVC